MMRFSSTCPKISDLLRNSGSGKPVTAVGGLLAVRYLFALWPSGCTAWEGLKFGRIFNSKYRQPTLNMKPTITVYPVYEFLHRLAKSDILEWRERGAAQLMLYWETSCRHIGAPGAFRLRAAENAGKKREKSYALIDESLTQAGERWRTAKERHEILQTAAVELDGIDAPEQRFFCQEERSQRAQKSSQHIN
ncbi:hypothetical protein IWZ00DRAFT_544153 [Phyllosticta capitalensis]